MFLYFPVKQVIVSPYLHSYRSYALSAFCLSSCRTVSLISDVSLNFTAVLRLAVRCTLLQLDPIHLIYVVQDFLA